LLRGRQDAGVGAKSSGIELATLAEAKKGVAMKPKSSSATVGDTSPSGMSESVVMSFHGVRYQVSDVSRAAAFYTQHFGFKLQHQQLPAFANVSLGDLNLLLSGPGASGSRPLPNGQRQQPGGWNRVVLRVADLPACIERLTNAGLRFRNEMEVGPGGKQIQVEDPDGNPIELFEPAR
jgi:glyoxylase I family protein